MLRKKTTLTSKKKVKLILEAMEEKKAVDPVVIEVRGRTVMTDFLIVAGGTSKIHIKAVVDAVIDKLADQRTKGKRLEGYLEGAWVLIDYGDVVVHVLAPEQREFYRLEAYWSGAEKGSPPPLSPEEV